MLVLVFLPITFLGFAISTLGSFAAAWNKASAEMPIPGQMTPPKYSQRSERTQKVVAVPKSTIMRVRRRFQGLPQR